jgi:hypothetical protein
VELWKDLTGLKNLGLYVKEIDSPGREELQRHERVIAHAREKKVEPDPVNTNGTLKRIGRGDLENQWSLLEPALLEQFLCSPFPEFSDESLVHTPLTGPPSMRPFYWGEGT